MGIMKVVAGRQHVYQVAITREVWRGVMGAVEAGNLDFVRFMDSAGKDVMVTPRLCSVIEYMPDQQVETKEDDDETDAEA